MAAERRVGAAERVAEDGRFEVAAAGDVRE